MLHFPLDIEFVFHTLSIFDIFDCVEKKSIDIIVSHVDNELEVVKGKLLCDIYCHTIIER